MDGVPQAVVLPLATQQHRDAASTGLSVLMDELAYGVVLAGATGRVLHANAAARRELACRDLLSMQDGCLEATEPGQARLLLQAFAKAQSGRRSLVTLRTESRRLSIAVVPLRHGRGANVPGVALLFSRPAVCDAVMLCFFARAHGLTPSEEQVLAILCQGYSAPQVAVQLKVAVSTVRSHVRSLCAKTRSNGVRALVGQVAVLPPIAAACLQDPLH
jgi:DNA-binding CsgD family transcriptional regulator